MTAGHLQQQQHSPPHLFSGRASGEVSISTGQTVAPGLCHQHQRWKRHHSGNFSYDLTDNPTLFLMSHEAESLFPHQVLIHLKRTLSRGECRGQSRSRNCWLMFTCSASPCLEVLFRELASRPTALRHFIQYLNETGEQKVLLQLLGSVSVPPEPMSPAHPF